MAAWTNIYKLGLRATAGTPLAYGIVGLKHELIYNGYSNNIVSDLRVWGDAVTAATKKFQQDNGLTADGQVGPITARRLFRKRAAALETQTGIPGQFLQRLKTLESANDPAAVGVVDPNDHGLMQINAKFHPDVTLAQAFDPQFALSWSAGLIVSNHHTISDWEGALAAYNVGLYYAQQWVKAGKPKSGGTVFSNGNDVFTVASKYVSLVKSMPL